MAKTSISDHWRYKGFTRQEMERALYGEMSSRIFWRKTYIEWSRTGRPELLKIARDEIEHRNEKISFIERMIK